MEPKSLPETARDLGLYEPPTMAEGNDGAFYDGIGRRGGVTGAPATNCRGRGPKCARRTVDDRAVAGTIALQHANATIAARATTIAARAARSS
jgi:hypothetical protein